MSLQKWLWVYNVILPELLVTFSLPQVTDPSAQQSSKTSTFLCLSALDESTRKSWPCSFFTSCADLAVLKVCKLVFESETWETSLSVTWNWNYEVDMKGPILAGISGLWEWIIPILFFQGWSQWFGQHLRWPRSQTGKSCLVTCWCGITAAQWKFKCLLGRGNPNVLMEYEIKGKNPWSFV